LGDGCPQQGLGLALTGPLLFAYEVAKLSLFLRMPNHPHKVVQLLNSIFMLFILCDNTWLTAYPVTYRSKLKKGFPTH